MTGTLRTALPLLAAVAAPLMLLRVLAARRTRAARLAALWKELGTTTDTRSRRRPSRHRARPDRGPAPDLWPWTSASTGPGPAVHRTGERPSDDVGATRPELRLISGGGEQQPHELFLDDVARLGERAGLLRPAERPPGPRTTTPERADDPGTPWALGGRHGCGEADIGAAPGPPGRVDVEDTGGRLNGGAQQEGAAELRSVAADADGSPEPSSSTPERADDPGTPWAPGGRLHGCGGAEVPGPAARADIESINSRLLDTGPGAGQEVAPLRSVAEAGGEPRADALTTRLPDPAGHPHSAAIEDTGRPWEAGAPDTPFTAGVAQVDGDVAWLSVQPETTAADPPGPARADHDRGRRSGAGRRPSSRIARTGSTGSGSGVGARRASSWPWLRFPGREPGHGTGPCRDRFRWPGVGARRPHREDPQLPLLAELLAACLAAGAAPGAAAGAVGGSLSGPLAAGLRRAATELRLGGEPAAVWKRFGQLPGASGLARRLELADVSGAPAVAMVAAEAAECRARRGRAAQTTARRAAVLVTGPLGLCFLPAFLLIGVAPVVIGLAKELM
ncbi:type II secretion system F family protein [Streptomyces xiamenensis]